MEQHESGGLTSFFNLPNSTGAAITSAVSTTTESPASNGGGFTINGVIIPDAATAAAVTCHPPEIVKKKRGRPRKYGTPEEAAAAKAEASAARSPSSSRKRDHQVIGSPTSTSSSNKKSQLDFEADTGQCFMPHVINVQPGEDVAQKVRTFMQQSKREFCILSASGTVCNVSLLQPASSGGSISYEGPFDILSLSGSFVRTDHGERSGGLSACLSATAGQIIGGGLAGPLIAVGQVEVIVATFVFNTKKEASTAAKVENSTPTLTSPNNSISVSNVGYRPVIEQSVGGGGYAMPDHQSMAGFMMQHQDLHMPMLPPPSIDWRSGPDTRNGLNYDFTGRNSHGLHESSENGDFEHLPD